MQSILKISNFIAFVVVLLFVNYYPKGNNPVAKQILKNQNPVQRDTIMLINTTANELGFYYENMFYEIVRFHLKPFDTISLFCRQRQIITQTNEYQNFFVLYPGDTIYVSANEKKNAIFSVKNDSIRNNELNLQWKINEGTLLNFMKLLKIRGDYSDSNYEVVDSAYESDYMDKINFIDHYSRQHELSAGYLSDIKDYYYAQLLAGKLWLAVVSKAKIKPDYLRALDTLSVTISKLDNRNAAPFYPYLSYNYYYYRLRKDINKNYFFDSLYNRVQRISNQYCRELSLFRIIKSAVEKKLYNAASVSAFLSSGQIDKAFKNYIQMSITNKTLMEARTSTGLFVMDHENSQFSLDSLMNTMRGYVVYLDFWASWCAPCRAEMPHAKILRKKYSGKKVRFIYFSIDEDLSQWKTANEEVGLPESESYILPGAARAYLKKKYQITSIPRHVLLDRNGKVAYEKAPGPGNTSLNTLLDKLLN